MDADGLRPNVIIVDARKDKKLSMLKQLAVTLVKGLNPNPAAIIKKLAGLVCNSKLLFIVFFLLKWLHKISFFEFVNNPSKGLRFLQKTKVGTRSCERRT